MRSGLVTSRQSFALSSRKPLKNLDQKAANRMEARSPSGPVLCRTSTSWLDLREKAVDDRDEPGHNESDSFSGKRLEPENEDTFWVIRSFAPLSRGRYNDRNWLGLVPVHRLNACVKEPTSQYPRSHAIFEIGSARRDLRVASGESSPQLLCIPVKVTPSARSERESVRLLRPS